MPEWHKFNMAQVDDILMSRKIHAMKCSVQTVLNKNFLISVVEENNKVLFKKKLLTNFQLKKECNFKIFFTRKKPSFSRTRFRGWHNEIVNRGPLRIIVKYKLGRGLAPLDCWPTFLRPASITRFTTSL